MEYLVRFLFCCSGTFKLCVLNIWMFDSEACPLLIEWRWLVTMDVLSYVLGVEHGLRAGWSLNTYLEGAAQEAAPQGQGAADAPHNVEERQRGGSVKLELVGSAFRSPKCSAQLRAVRNKEHTDAI